MSNHEHTNTKSLFGFWIYIMSDCILFATLFATYIVLKDNVHDGLPAKHLFNMQYVLAETILLLVSSLTCGFAVLATKKYKKNLSLLFLILTFILGSIFIVMEVNEFLHLISQSNVPSRSGFLSAFFTLVGTHGLHVLTGLIWIFFLILQILIYGIRDVNQTKIFCLGLFWHFLDVIWIFVFTIVYLMGAL